MSLGVIMLCHTDLDRAAQIAQHWARSGCPVVVHVDQKVPDSAYLPFVAQLSEIDGIHFSRRFRCEWGMWGLVAASQAAGEQMLRDFPAVDHIFLASGACMPLRPVAELLAYLKARPKVDFIESVTTADVPWTVGGLDKERFTLRFPFSWRRHRAMFDGFVQLQRALKLKRKIPPQLVPHMGSQWWCLTRHTLEAILTDPNRPVFDRYFRRVWIPDESYFQTLVRLHGTQIESRSLTLAKFDFQGKPHVFYDDHLQLLKRSDCFVARKIWPHAEQLFKAFLTETPRILNQNDPKPGKIDRIFAKAVTLRTRGRPGLYMHSSFSQHDWENSTTAGPYSVFHGFSDVFREFSPWLQHASGARAHGHLFAAERAEFSEGQSHFNGALSDNARLRDANPGAFLTNLIWNTRGERQCFHFGPRDQQDILPRIVSDPNASIWVISGAWIIPLCQSTQSFDEVRQTAAHLQKIEAKAIETYRASKHNARVRVWSLAEFVETPTEILQSVVDETTIRPRRRLAEAPQMRDMSGITHFLQKLKNEGMLPYLVGDFPLDTGAQHPTQTAPKRPYLVR